MPGPGARRGGGSRPRDPRGAPRGRREACSDDPASDSVRSTVIGDLRRLAEQAEPDPPTVDEQAAGLLAEHGIEAAGLDAEHPGRLEVRAGNRNPFDVAREVTDYLLK